MVKSIANLSMYLSSVGLSEYYQTRLVQNAHNKFNTVCCEWPARVGASLKAGVGFIRKNKPQFWHFLFCTQTVKISGSS